MSELPKYLEELCEVKLSPKEIETASDSFVQACNSEAAAKIEHKNTMDAIKETKEAAFLLMTKKRESRLVRCLADWNFPVSGRVTLTRTDTQETIERKMTTEEIAPFLPLAAKKDEPKAEEAKPEEAPPQLLLSHDKALIIDAEVSEEDPSDRTDLSEGTPDERFDGYGHIEELKPDGDILSIHLSFEGKPLCFANFSGARRGATCSWAPDEDEFSKICRTCLAEDQRRKFNQQKYAAADQPEIATEALTVLCDKCGHWHDSTLTICPKCVGKLDADQVKARDFAAGWAVRFKEAGCASVPPPWRASDENEDFDHLYRFDHSTTAFCGHEASTDEREKYKTQPGFPPDHFACPECISKGHRIVDKEIDALKPAKKPKAPKAPKVPATPAVPEETKPETQEEV